MYSKVLSGIALGIDGMLITVETDISNGLPGLSLVGYLTSSTKEAGDRVRVALRNSGFPLQAQKITVNLSPADIRKDGAAFDLAIAVGIMISSGVVAPPDNILSIINKTVFLGELGLDGKLLPVRGVLPIVDYAHKTGIENVFLPIANSREASFVKGVNIIPVANLTEVAGILSGEGEMTIYSEPEDDPDIRPYKYDLADIRGQEVMKQGVMIAVAGFHNIMLTGEAGSGKSMIAKCIPGIMPPLTYDEAMELTKIYSVSGMLSRDEGILRDRPFRSPHQNISLSALIGGGTVPIPGEVSLASNGVLFLDEFPEFNKNIIESLRQPMEDKVVTISRTKATYTFPSNFMLVSARNNCPCGFYPDRSKCRCSAGEIRAYQNKISHPIMDRIDIRLEVRHVRYNELFSDRVGMTSAEARDRIMLARDRQSHRFRNEDYHYNSAIPQNQLGEYIHLSPSGERMMQGIYESKDISARGYFRMLRLIRTIADVEDREEITEEDIQQASFYRNDTESGGAII